ncbi:MAG: SMP-30/gluconolactonase/LRE family protein [Propionivibrio sp.]
MTTQPASNDATPWQAPLCTLGESLIWDERSHRFWWVNVPAGMLYRGEEGGQASDHWQFPEALGHVALTEDSNHVVLGLASGLELFDTATATRARLASVPHAAPGMRINDGRCDRHGHLVFGTMSEGGKGARGAYWWFGAADGLRRLDLPAPAIPNSICFSPDGALMYFTDSTDKVIRICDYDAMAGKVSNIRIFSDPGPVAWEPDGSCVDAEGGVWNAQWGAGRIVRYRQDGKLDRIIETPALQPTCPCLAAENFDVLCSTSARIGIETQRLSDADGNILSWHGLGVKGLPEGRVAGL